MPVFVDPFTGMAFDLPAGQGPIGDFAVIPRGTAVYQGDPSEPVPLTPRLPAGAAYTPETSPFVGGMYGFAADRGPTFYLPGDEYRILTAVEDLASLQAALDGLGLLTGGYLVGVPDAKTAAAMRVVLGAANASGLSWDEVLRRGLEGLEGRGAAGRGAGSGSAAAALTDEDIIALANQVARGLLGRALRHEEISGFVPAFRARVASGTSPTVAAQNVVREETAPEEASGWTMGGVMDTIARVLSQGGG